MDHRRKFACSWNPPNRPLRWGIYEAGLIADCVREVSPGETAFGRTFEEPLRVRGSFEADSGADD
jgi:hypothetical protein